MDPVTLKTFGSTGGGEAVARTGTSAEAGPPFTNSLKDALAQVNDAQLEANQAVDALVTGRTENIHQAMIALQKADVSFQLMMQVRNKLVTAYEEIQRMQI
ncbi:flagellar hook-basal body complex protein FliE [Nitrospira sp.]|nr:flagellar hook-basal body complex protein FliE [Nitrospira sp.]